MFDRKRLDPFSPKEFLMELADFEEAHRIQRAGMLLSEMREKAGLSVQDLAERLHRAPEEVVRIERGQLLESPAMSLMLQVAEICDEEISFNVRQRLGAA
jgi:transcriptional regulator with XRE-family HTH domain